MQPYEPSTDVRACTCLSKTALFTKERCFLEVPRFLPFSPSGKSRLRAKMNVENLRNDTDREN